MGSRARGVEPHSDGRRQKKLGASSQERMLEWPQKESGTAGVEPATTRIRVGKGRRFRAARLALYHLSYVPRVGWVGMEYPKGRERPESNRQRPELGYDRARLSACARRVSTQRGWRSTN